MRPRPAFLICHALSLLLAAQGSVAHLFHHGDHAACMHPVHGHAHVHGHGHGEVPHEHGEGWQANASQEALTLAGQCLACSLLGKLVLPAGQVARLSGERITGQLLASRPAEAATPMLRCCAARAPPTAEVG